VLCAIRVKTREGPLNQIYQGFLGALILEINLELKVGEAKEHVRN
jgi:hypothetical protein